MEEKIISSPCKFNKSIHNLRTLRRSKRNSSIIDNQENKTADRFLKLLYEDDEIEPTNPEDLNKTYQISSLVTDYNPFKMEKILCMADHIGSSNLKETQELPQSHQGFLTCQKISKVEKESEDPFVITDSELLNCCDEVDEMLMKSPPQTKGGLSLANSILEDFSLSPLSTNPEATLSSFWEYSPEFILKSKPTKAYGRKMKKIDCNKRLEFNEYISSDDDDCASKNSSFLSIQENNSQFEDKLNTTEIPDISQRLSENLLNLSAFYTQGHDLNSRDRFTLPGEVITTNENEAGINLDENVLPPNKVVNLLRDICSLRQKPTSCTSYTSDQEFNGFADNEADIIHEISLSERDSCISPLNATLLSPQSLRIAEEDREMVLLAEDDTDIISCQYLQEAYDYKSEWNNDCPEFASIKTQEVLLEHKNASLKNCNNDTNSESYNQSKKKLSYLSDQQEDMNSMVIKNDHSKKEVENNASELPRIYDKPSTSKEAIKSNCNNISNAGFQTANGKIVKISTKAQKSIEKLLTEFQMDSELSMENDLENVKNKVMEKNSGFHAAKAKMAIGHKFNENDTARVKGSICNDKNNDHFLSELGTYNNKMSPQCTLSENIGFQTAGGKTVAISNKAKKSVDNLFKEIYSDTAQTNEENLLIIKNKINQANLKMPKSHVKYLHNETPYDLVGDENDLANIVFSEWPLEEQIQSQSLKSVAKVSSEKDQLECIESKLLSQSNIPTSEMNGFQTAGGNNVIISDKAKNIVANLLKDIQFNCDIKNQGHDLVEIKHKIQSKNNALKATNAVCNKILNNNAKTIVGAEENYSHISMENLEPSSSKDLCFQTHGGNRVVISEKANMATPNVLQEFSTDFCDIRTYEENILANKNITLSSNFKMKKLNTTTATEHNSPLVTVKRSLDTRESSLPLGKKRLPLDAKQLFTELSVQSPLNTSATKSIISRKNLLSLSKKRKRRNRFSPSNLSDNSTNDKPSDEDNDPTEYLSKFIEESTETPVKKKLVSNPITTVETPATPNINEFFNDAVNSSTPRNETCINRTLRSMETISGGSHKKFTTKQSQDTSSNITLNSSNPTVNERIGRLQIYGNPPAVSPITIDTHNNSCRPSGLRRTRSMFRKPNN